MGSTQSDIDRGREALKYFHNQASTYPIYSLGFEQMIDTVSGGAKKTPFFLEGLGFAIEQIDISTSKLKTSMENLADQGRGKLPATSQAFFKALSDEVQNINWITAAPEVVKGVAVDLVKGVAEGGESIIGVLKTMNVIIPIMVVLGVVWIGYSKIEKATK
jgi:hypothetical protein